MTMANAAIFWATLAFAGQLGCSSHDGGARGTDVTAGGAANDAGADGSGTAGVGSAASSASGAAGTGSETTELEAPDEEQSLLAFLEAKQYAAWPKESEVHPSAGPHGEGVRVYYSPSAAEALKRGASTFPAGAASVKELIAGGMLSGYSVWVKVQDAADSGNGIFWYERIRRADGTDAVYGNARGSRVCVDCHHAGKDYSLSTLPFE